MRERGRRSGGEGNSDEKGFRFNITYVRTRIGLMSLPFGATGLGGDLLVFGNGMETSDCKVTVFMEGLAFCA